MRTIGEVSGSTAILSPSTIVGTHLLSFRYATTVVSPLPPSARIRINQCRFASPPPPPLPHFFSWRWGCVERGGGIVQYLSLHRVAEELLGLGPVNLMQPRRPARPIN